MAIDITNHKCPACTGPLHFVGESGMLECDYCGSKYTVEEIEKLYAEDETEAAEGFEVNEARKEKEKAEFKAMGMEWSEEEAKGMKTYSCPSCGAENIRYSGFGTQRVEQELKIRFPDAKVIRMDADTTANKNSHSKVLKAFASGEYDILIGTQMVAKGLDFPDVTLVGITSADKELYNNDFRCSERSFDLITQVVGRAGRGKKKGRAVIQTVSPDNNIIKIASKQDYKRFFDSEINLRKALIYPPFCDICEIFFSAASQEAVNLCARTFFERLVSLNENEFNDLKIIILGPMAPRVSKINEFYRQRILIKCKNSLRFREYVRIILKEISSDKAFRNVMISADINPENLN